MNLTMKKGFTLIELLAVITIIGIIALITYPIINDIFANSKKKSFKASVEEIVNVVEIDYSEFGRKEDVTYNFDSPNITCDVCTTEIEYNGEIEEGTGKVILNDGEPSYVHIENKSYIATLNGKGQIEIEEK